LSPLELWLKTTMRTPLREEMPGSREPTCPPTWLGWWPPHLWP